MTLRGIAPGGGGSGTVTHTGALTANAVILGNGTADITALASLGTTTTVLHGNAAGAPTFASVAVADIATGTAGNLITWDASGNPAVVATGNSTQVLTSNGAGAAPTFQAAASGASTWDAINAAVASKTTANGTNSIVYNTAPTADSKVAWTFGETSAATNGTLTSGLANQVLLKLATLSASTQSPLQIYNRGAFALQITPATGALLVSDAGVTFATTSGTKIISQTGGGSGGVLNFYENGTLSMQLFGSGGNGTQIRCGPTTLNFVAPQFADAGNSQSGMTINSNPTPIVAIAVGGTESCRWVGAANANSYIYQCSRGSADATAYAINILKARGTVASPTVITTADALATISGWGYVGGTNKYLEAARIEFDSAGTIGDSTSGIGSVVKIMGTTQGTDTAVQPTITITGGSTASLQLNGTGMFTANGATLWAVGNNCPGNAAVQEWLTIKDSAGTTRYIPCF